MSTDAAARGLAIRSGSGAIKPHGDKVLQAAAEREEPGAPRRIRGTVNPADLMTKNLDGKRLVMLCDLVDVQRVGFRPS